MIAKLTKGGLRAAMTQFDAALRGSIEWQGWEQNKAHKYAIEEAGELYPVKKIVPSLPASQFPSSRAASVVDKLMTLPLRRASMWWTSAPAIQIGPATN